MLSDSGTQTGRNWIWRGCWWDMDPEAWILKFKMRYTRLLGNIHLCMVSRCKISPGCVFQDPGKNHLGIHVADHGRKHKCGSSARSMSQHSCMAGSASKSMSLESCPPVLVLDSCKSGCSAKSMFWGSMPQPASNWYWLGIRQHDFFAESVSLRHPHTSKNLLQAILLHPCLNTSDWYKSLCSATLCSNGSVKGAVLSGHAGIIPATSHVDHACLVLFVEKTTASGLDATANIGSCRNAFQLEFLRLRLSLGRLLAHIHAAAAASPASGRGPSSGPLSESSALPSRSSTVQVSFFWKMVPGEGQPHSKSLAPFLNNCTRLTRFFFCTRFHPNPFAVGSIATFMSNSNKPKNLCSSFLTFRTIGLMKRQRWAVTAVIAGDPIKNLTLAWNSSVILNASKYQWRNLACSLQTTPNQRFWWPGPTSWPYITRSSAKSKSPGPCVRFLLVSTSFNMYALASCLHIILFQHYLGNHRLELKCFNNFVSWHILSTNKNPDPWDYFCFLLYLRLCKIHVSGFMLQHFFISRSSAKSMYPNRYFQLIFYHPWKKPLQDLCLRPWGIRFKIFPLQGSLQNPYFWIHVSISLYLADSL